MKKIVVIAGAAFVLFTACNGGKSEESKTTETDTTTVVKENPETPATGVAGEYFGTVPCRDCDKTEITLSLKADGTYRNVARYIKKKTEDVNTSKGKWSQKGEQIELMADGGDSEVVGDPMLYKVSGDSLTMVDQSGKAAEKYVLKKTN